MSMKPFLIEEAEAMEFVQERHNPKQKYGKYPYFFHLYQVNSVAKEFNLNDRVILLSTWLHDALEDTATNPSDLSQAFGEDVARTVYYVTDHKGWNRAERHERLYREMVSHPRAVAVKLCDRLANVRFGNTAKDGCSPNYKREYADFKGYLWGKGGEFEGRLGKIWNELDLLLLR